MRLPTRKKELERQQTEEPDLHVTTEKLERMKRDLEHLISTERGIAAAEVIRTGEMGDFSENAGYQWAKQNLRRINGRILMLTERIAHAVPIVHDSTSTTVKIGSTVTLRLCSGSSTTSNEEKHFIYEILGSQESNPSRGKISYRSPIGNALLGSRIGDNVDVIIGDRTVTYCVEAIS